MDHVLGNPGIPGPDPADRSAAASGTISVGPATGATGAAGTDRATEAAKAELTALLVDRMGFSAKLVIAATLLYAVLDVVLAQPHRVALHGLEAGLIAIASLNLGLARFPRLLPFAPNVATGMAIGLLAVIACGSVLRDEVQAGSTLMVVVALVTAAILPLGLRCQWIISLAALLCIAGMVVAEPGSLDFFTRDPAYIIAITLGLGCSLPLAHQHRANRLAMFREHQRLRAAQAEIQAMNAVLERRVEERTAELEAAITDLRAFGYAISHDLRQPLRAVCSFAQILQEGAAERLSAEEADFAGRIHAGARRMDGLLDEFLRLSRVASQRMLPARVDLSACARRIARDLERDHPERRVAWRIDDGMVVEGDRELLMLLLEELFANAWKFTAGIDEARISFRVETDASGSPAFVVRDNGCGFEPARARELFKLFSRGVAGSAAEGFGTGLASAERIVRRHGGRIAAEGEPGRGAALRFTLGVAAVGAAVSTPQSPPA